MIEWVVKKNVLVSLLCFALVYLTAINTFLVFVLDFGSCLLALLCSFYVINKAQFCDSGAWHKSLLLFYIVECSSVQYYRQPFWHTSTNHGVCIHLSVIVRQSSSNHMHRIISCDSLRPIICIVSFKNNIKDDDSVHVTVTFCQSWAASLFKCPK